MLNENETLIVRLADDVQAALQSYGDAVNSAYNAKRQFHAAWRRLVMAAPDQVSFLEKPHIRVKAVSRLRIE